MVEKKQRSKIGKKCLRIENGKNMSGIGKNMLRIGKKFHFISFLHGLGGLPVSKLVFKGPSFTSYGGSYTKFIYVKMRLCIVFQNEAN